MNTKLNLDAIDTDGLLAQASSIGSRPSSRRAMIRTSAIAGGGLIAAGTMFSAFLSPAQAAIVKGEKSKANDVRILQYALTLEYLEAAFYASGLANITFKDPNLAYFAKTAGAHEAEHVTTLQSVLGSKSIPTPTFNFGTATTDEATFAATAEVLEDTGVSAYAGQGTNILQKPVIVAALSIHSVEARHASWVRFINGGGAPLPLPLQPGNGAPAPATYDKAQTEKQVLRAVTGTKFITG